MRALKGRGEAAAIRHDESMILAWHIEALHRSRRLPKLQTLLGRRRGPRPAQTPEQMLAVIKTLNAAFGGVDLTRPQPKRKP